MISEPYAKVIVNPAAGCGSTWQKWPRIREVLTQYGLLFDHVYTEGRGHAMELAKEAGSSGYGLVVTVGGDGTLNEVVNGLIDSPNATDTTLGILTTGTCCDFARSLGVPRDIHKGCLNLIKPRKVKVDAGVIEYQNNGLQTSRFFIGVASLGFDAKVVKTFNKRQTPLSGIIPYGFAILHSLRSYRNKNVHLQVGDEREDIRIFSVVIANAGFYGKGMHVAPEADLQDGLFDVIVVGDIGKIAFLWALPQVYRGTHGKHPKVQLKKASHITFQSAEQVLVQADGELFGEGPASFRILPSALTIAI